MEITWAQKKQLQEAVLNAFRSPASLEQLVGFGLEKNLYEITDSSNLQNMVFGLIEWADSRGKLEQLIAAAVEQNGDNPKIQAIAAQLLGNTPAGAAVAAAQPLVVPPTSGSPTVGVAQWGEEGSFLDTTWLTNALAAARTTCRVESARSYGTGFLVGSDLVLTANYVLQDLLSNPTTADQVELRFGYARREDGSIDSGTVYKLATDWLVDSSPSEALCFALVRLAKPAGEDQTNGQKRGWLRPVPHRFQQGEDLYIVQFPLLEGSIETAPLKIVLGANAVQEVNDSGTRVTYRVKTAPGAGGAPCFTGNWEVVAIHRGRTGEGSFKEGVPLDKICAQPQVKSALGL